MHFVFTGRIRDCRGEATTYLNSMCFFSQVPVATIKVKIDSRGDFERVDYAILGTVKGREER